MLGRGEPLEEDKARLNLSVARLRHDHARALLHGVVLAVRKLRAFKRLARDVVAVHVVGDDLRGEERCARRRADVGDDIAGLHIIAAEAAATLHLISQKERLVIIPGNNTSDDRDMYLSHHHVPVIMKLSQCADIVQDYMESHPQYSYHYFENISTAEEYHSSHQAELKRRVFPYFSLMIIFNEQTRKDDSAK